MRKLIVIEPLQHPASTLPENGDDRVELELSLHLEVAQGDVKGDEGTCPTHAAPTVDNNGRGDRFCVLTHLQNDIQQPDARKGNATGRPRAVEVVPHKTYLLADGDSNRAMDPFGLHSFLQRL